MTSFSTLPNQANRPSPLIQPIRARESALANPALPPSSNDSFSLQAGSSQVGTTLKALSPATLPVGLAPAITAMIGAFQQGKTATGNPLDFITLKNGHRIIVEHRSGGIASVYTAVNGGSIIENGINHSPLYRDLGFPSGIAHLDEHMRFLSTQGHPQKNSLVSQLFDYGTEMNASTGPESVNFYINFNREDLSSILKLHAEQLLKPLYNPQFLDQEKSAVLNEIGLRHSQVPRKMLNELHHQAFARYANQTSGTPADVKTTTAEQLALYFKAIYQPGNLVTAVSGDIQTVDVLNALAPALMDNPNLTKIPVNQALQSVIQPGTVKRAVVYDPQIRNPQVLIGFPAPSDMKPRESLAMNMLTRHVDRNVDAPLKRRLVKELKIATAAFSSFEPNKQSGLMNTIIETMPGQENAVVQEVSTLLSSYANTPVSEVSLASIQNEFIHARQSAHETVNDTATLLADQALRDNLSGYFNEESLIRSITPADLQQVARKYIAPMGFVVIEGQPSLPAAPPAVINPSTTNVSATALPLPQGSNGIRFGSHTGLAAPRTIPPTPLGNGALLFSTQTDPGRKTALSIELPLSNAVNAQLPLLRAMLMEGSAVIRDLLQALPAEGIQLYMMNTPTSLKLTGDAPPGQEARLAQAMLHLMQPPPFNTQEFQRHRTLAKQRLENAKNYSAYIQDTTTAQKIYGTNAPYARPFSVRIAALDQSTPDGLWKNYQNTLGDTENARVTLTSGLSPALQKQLLNTMFDLTGWKQTRFDHRTMTLQAPTDLPADRHQFLAIPSESASQALITMTAQSPAPSDPDYATFKLIQKLLTGFSGDYSYRNVLRTQQGLVYGSQSGTRGPLGKDGDAFETSFEVPFDKMRTALGVASQIPLALVNQPISAADLMRAQRQLTFDIRDSTQTSSGLNGFLSPWMQRNIEPPTVDGFLESAARVTPADIQRVARRVFGIPAMEQVSVSAPRAVLARQLPGFPMTEPVP